MKNLKKHQGSMLLELALILPVFLLILAAVVQFGFILSAKAAVNAAAYEAARSATISGSPYEAANIAIENYASSGFPGWSYSDRLKASVYIPSTNPGTEIAVEVTYSIPLFFKNISAFSSADNSYIDVKGISRMRIEEKE